MTYGFGMLISASRVPTMISTYLSRPLSLRRLFPVWPLKVYVRICSIFLTNVQFFNFFYVAASFYANGNLYEAGYYLTDGIYPEYATFVKTFTDPVDEKRKYYKKKQESARKDIERAFGVLKKRWKVISFPSRYWTKDRMHDVIYTCIILHNMILQDEGKAFCQNYDDSDPSLDPAYWEQQTPMEQRIQNSNAVRSRETHNMLTADLVDHLWENRNQNAAEVVPEDVNNYVSDDD